MILGCLTGNEFVLLVTIYRKWEMDYCSYI